MIDLPLAADLLIAALVGLAVGIEREWTGHTAGPDGRFAGARTFTLLGAIGGLSGWLLRSGYSAPAIVLLAAGVLLPAVAYATTVRRPGTTTDGTTEVVAVLVVGLGTVAGLGERTLASAAATLTVLLLAEKSAMQAALHRVAAHELRAALQFAVLALVVLPLIPDGAYGPYAAFRPRSLWIVVLIFSGLNFAGYIARRAVGETRGLGVTGLLGGLVSSTAVSLTFSRRSRVEPQLALPLALGVVAACTMLVPRLLVITAMLQPRVATLAIPVLLPPLLAGIGVITYVLWTEQSAGSPPDDGHVAANGLGTNPLGLVASLQMAVAFQLVLFGIAWVQREAGTTGVLASATLLGLTDMDALTVSMTRYGATPETAGIAAAAIGIGVLSNTVLKLALAVTIGEPRYRWRAATGLLTLAAGSVVGLWWGWPS